MARIEDEMIERLKDEVDLAGLVRRSGVELKRAGADLVGRCPFHDDGTPSLVVTPKKGLWHCMGACNAGGSVIDWVMRAERVSFRHAVELLRSGETVIATPNGPRPQRSTVRRLPSPVEAGAGEHELLAQVVTYYHGVLTSSPEALAYLKRRKIDDPEAVTHFRLGYANRTLGLRLPEKNRVAGAELRGRLEKAGIYRPSGHEHLAGSIVVPVITPDGRVAEIYGRKIRDDLRPGTPLHLYLPGPHAGVFNEEAMRACSDLIVTESLIDALSFFCAGFKNVTAAYGTNGFTTEHMEAIMVNKVERVLIAYDHDEAGDSAASALAADLMASGVECLRVTCPHGADVNDVAMASDDPRIALGRLVRSARWIGAGERPHATTDDRVTVPSSVAPSVGEETAGPVIPAKAARHDELVITTGGHHWRVRNISLPATPGNLKVNLMVSSGERFHIDVVDLYSARQRSAFVNAAVAELRSDAETLKAELGSVLLAAEEAQAAAEKEASSRSYGVPEMATSEREAALELLSDPDLVGRVTGAFSDLGLVGESDPALVAWLVLVSRLAERPLGAVIQSSSAAGKSTLAEAALSLIPGEQKAAYSAMTGQALYYLGEADLAHKVLSIAEEEGASRASYALKLLVSEGRLSIAAAGKDPLTGRLVTNTYEMKGPVALIMTTTAAEIDPELANRLMVLAVDEGRSQTRAVHVAQRRSETLEGLVERLRREETVNLHHNAQRLLSPMAVVNPHATALSFPDDATRHRRDHAKLLGLIRASALAHQRQRVRKTVEISRKLVTYLEASQADIELAERLAKKVLATTTDELAPATRRLLAQVADFAKPGTSFTRRELREATGLGDSQLKVHLARLVDLEYLTHVGSGPATSYSISDYDSYRPVPRGDRPGDNGDRPDIGRFPGTERKPAPTRDGGNYDSDRPVIGRVRSLGQKHGATREDDDHDDNRPGNPQIRVLGEEKTGNGVVAMGEAAR